VEKKKKKKKKKKSKGVSKNPITPISGQTQAKATK
jgi:hypothetical protein